MAWVTISGAIASTATRFGGLDHGNKIANMFNGTDISDTVTINSAVTWTFEGAALQISDSDDSHSYDITGGALSANVVVNLPALTTTDTFAMIDTAQTFSKENTFSLSRIDASIATPSNPSTTLTKVYTKAVDANNSARYVLQEIGGTFTEVRLS